MVTGLFNYNDNLIQIGSLSCSSKKYSGTTESITLGGTVSAANVVFFTAEDRHIFADNGINFTFNTYGTGPGAIGDLLNSKIDVAYTSEYRLSPVPSVTITSVS